MNEQSAENHNTFRHLINGLVEGTLTPEQVCQLEQQIQTSPEAMKLYMEIVTLSVGLRKYSQTQREAMRELQQSPNESLLWQNLALEEKEAPAVKIARRRRWWFKRKSKPVEIQPLETNIQRVYHRISLYPITFLITASAALILLLVYIQLAPSRSVAILSDSVDAVWDNSVNQFKEGKGLYPGSGRQTLKSGFAQIRFESGAEVIFEAPCQFRLENRNQLFLKQGQIFAYVPGQAVGFTVRTPNSRIVDLGTEFGLSIDQDGNSHVQMFSGKASLTAGSGQEQISELLLAGQACNVDAQTSRITIASFLKGQFVQRINSSANIIWRGENSINLADMITGGNGLQKEPRGCLNPTTGIIEPELKYLAPEEMRYPPQTYTSVPDSPYIDGVFVPNGKNGLVQVSSLDHKFLFPQTSATIWYPVTPITYYVTDKGEGSQSPGEGMVSCPAFYLHANLGITFDLDAIRKAYPGAKITGFRTQYGIRWDSTPRHNKVDFRVLVDGQKKHEHLAKSAERKVEDLYIPLSDTDRFLTLSTTEADDGLGFDWGVFINPLIELEAGLSAD